MSQVATSHDTDQHAFIESVRGFRYHVKDVARSVGFYTQNLGFKLEHQVLPAFASISLGDAKIFLSGPGASGSRALPGGQRQESGGWNRVVLNVSDLPGCISAFKKAGLNFRNEMETGPGDGKFRSKIRTGIQSSCLKLQNDVAANHADHATA